MTIEDHSERELHLRLFKEDITVLFHITDYCNLDCKHCFINASHTPTHQYSLDEISSILSDLKTLRAFNITFSGGEPTLHNDFLQILETATEEGFTVSFVSNGTLITKELTKNLHGLVRFVLISVDGPEEYHDAFRGKKGAYKRTMKGINALREAEIPFGLQFTVTKESYPFIEWIAKTANELGAQSLKLEPLFVGGRAQNIAPLSLDEREVDQLSKLTTQLYGKYLATTGVYVGIYSKKALTEHPCNAYACFGNTCHRHASNEPREIIILPDGDVAPVDSLLNPRFYIGNIKEKSLRAVFQEYYGSPKQQLFLELCRKVFEERVISYPYEAIPWTNILIAESWRVEHD
ncbi:MAG: radical SAM protein [Theionarchaea archaeon]|nr:radical SAM protein [Theionarchaea archaeon]